MKFKHFLMVSLLGFSVACSSDDNKNNANTNNGTATNNGTTSGTKCDHTEFRAGESILRGEGDGGSADIRLIDAASTDADLTALGFEFYASSADAKDGPFMGVGT